jgi:sec-independent protein translocase protein TatC
MAKKNEMSFLDHEDLRWLLVRSTLAIVIMALPRFFSDYLFDTIIFGPVRPTFTIFFL